MSKEKLDAIHEDIGEIKKALFGNGREGLLDRTTRLEERQGRVSWKVIVSIVIAGFALIKEYVFK